MKTFVFGTAGHVDHGKTTLIRALTGIDTDRFREEKERGLTIDIGFAHLELPGDVRLGIVDVPGHRDFIGNMLTGTTGLDAVLLVVSAADGPMPQTREHLQIASLLGIRQGVIALTNVDRVEDDFADLAEDATRQEVRAITGHGDWPLVRVDAVGGDGVEDVRRELGRLAGRLPAAEPDPVFRLPVDRAFTVTGTGTVVTGTSWTGRVSVGDRLWVLPSGREVRVRSLQVHGQEQSSVGARRRCAVGLVGVGVDEVGRGDTLVSLGSWSAARRVGVAFELLPDGKRLVEHGLRIRLWLGTQEVMARVELPGRDAAGPGERGHAVLACETPLVARVGDRGVLRFYSPVELLGGARVVEIEPPRSWTRRTGDWGAVLDADPAVSIAAAVRLAGGAGTTREQLLPATPHPVPEAPPPGTEVRAIGQRWFSADRVARLEQRLGAWLARAHEEAPRAPALPLESLRGAADPADDPALIEAAIDGLAAANRVVLEGPRIRLAGHEVRLSETEIRLQDAVKAEIRAGGLMPPDPAGLAERVGASRPLVHDLLRLLVESGDVVQVTPELYLAPEEEASLRDVTLSVIAARELASPADFREALGVTRRYLIPLLEYLDGIGWSRRTGDGRIAGPAAKD